MLSHFSFISSRARRGGGNDGDDYSGGGVNDSLSLAASAKVYMGRISR